MSGRRDDGAAWRDEAEWRAKIRGPHDLGRRRIAAAEFEALPSSDPGGCHVEWKETRAGRWFICSRSTSCGYVSEHFWRPVVSIPAAPADGAA